MVNVWKGRQSVSVWYEVMLRVIPKPHPLQRAVRDLLAIRVHPAGNLGKASRSYERLAFGLENEDPFL